jgi:hypothetical protein
VELKESFARLAHVRDVKFAVDRGNDPISLLLATDRNSKSDNRLANFGLTHRSQKRVDLQ